MYKVRAGVVHEQCKWSHARSSHVHFLSLAMSLFVLGYVCSEQLLLQSCLVLLQFYLHSFLRNAVFYLHFLGQFFLFTHGGSSQYDKPMGRNETTVGVGLGLRRFGSLGPDVRPGCSIRSWQFLHKPQEKKNWCLAERF